jgi:ParB family chromosome partitioning protein
MLSQPRVALDATGIRVLSTIGEAVPVRLMKRDLLFVAEHLVALIDEGRLAIPTRQVRR